MISVRPDFWPQIPQEAQTLNVQGESLVPLLTGKTVSEKLQAATSSIQRTLNHQYPIFRGSAAIVLRILDLLWMLDVGCWIFFNGVGGIARPIFLF